VPAGVELVPGEEVARSEGGGRGGAFRGIKADTGVWRGRGKGEMQGGCEGGAFGI